jgi:hypothetical protein
MISVIGWNSWKSAKKMYKSRIAEAENADKVMYVSSEAIQLEMKK